VPVLNLSADSSVRLGKSDVELLSSPPQCPFPTQSPICSPSSSISFGPSSVKDYSGFASLIDSDHVQDMERSLHSLDESFVEGVGGDSVKVPPNLPKPDFSINSKRSQSPEAPSAFMSLNSSLTSSSQYVTGLSYIR
jgi:hypothetical protein